MKRTIQLIISCLVFVAIVTTSWAVLAHGEDEDDRPTTDIIEIDFVPTYAEHIAPIIEFHCAGCHIAGEFGHDSFAMDTTEDIIAGAEDIGIAVSTGYMPPWPPSDASQHFLYDRSLSDEEIALIVAWAVADAPSDFPVTAVQPSLQHAQPIVEADLVVEMSAPYTPDGTQSDDYRCFMMDLDFTEDTYIAGYNVIPGSKIMAHHTILYPGTQAMRSAVAEVDGADGQPGWECFGGNGLSIGGPDTRMMGPILPLLQAVGGLSELQYILTLDDPVAQLDVAIDATDDAGALRNQIDGFGGTEMIVRLLNQTLGSQDVANEAAVGILGSWVPGNVPAQFPDDTGLLIPAGGFIIMQMHYNTEAGIEADQSQLILDLADEDENPASLRILAINAPVEVPCPANIESEACNRDVAIQTAGNGSDLLLALCGQTLADYADVDSENVTTFCDMRVPTSGWAISILSHMHTIGKSTRTFLNPDTDDEQILIDIPFWDFDWQGDYWFAEPIWLNQGDIIRVTCTYNNSESRSNPEPRYIVAGEGTNDEMCLNIIAMLPAEAGSPMPTISSLSNID